MAYVIVVFGMIILDILTGLLQSLKTGTFKSSIMKEGLLSKAAIIIGLILIYSLDYLMPMIGITIEIPAVQTFTIYVVIMEFGSILENLGKINPQLADILSKFFDTFTKEIKEDKQNED